MAFGDRLVDFTLGLLELGFSLSLLVDESGVLGVEQVRSLVRLVEFGFSEFAASFGLFNTVSELFDFTSEKVGSSINNSHLFRHIFASSFSFVEFGEVILDGSLKHLGLFGGFVGLSVGVSELDFEVVEVAFELLLGSDGFGSCLGFRVQTSLHGFKSSLTVSSGVIDLFFLFSKSSFEVLFRLRNFNSQSKDLGLFGLNSRFSFLKSGLKFVSLLFESSLGFFELVNRFSAFAELIGEVGDFFLQVLVLSFDSLKAVKSFFVSVLGLEELGAHAWRFLLCRLKFDLKFFFLLLVLGNDLVKVSLFFVQSGGG